MVVETPLALARLLDDCDPVSLHPSSLCIAVLSEYFNSCSIYAKPLAINCKKILCCHEIWLRIKDSAFQSVFSPLAQYSTFFRNSKMSFNRCYGDRKSGITIS